MGIVVKNKKIKVKLVKSPIGCTKKQKANLTGLGLKRIGNIREIVYNRSIAGMLEIVKHLIVIS